MATVKYSKIILLLLLITAFAIIYFKVTDDIHAIIGMAGILLVLWVYRIFSNAARSRRINRIVNQGNRASAKIISCKIYKKNTFILQLSISGSDGPYITSYVHHNPDNNQMESYTAGKNLNVYINPLDRHEIIIPEPKKQKTPVAPNILGHLVWISIMFVSVGLPILIGVLDTSDRVFKDVAFVPNNANLGNIWELRYKSPKKIFIRIIDPITNETIKKIKDKSQIERDYYLNLSIYEQNQNVVIVGEGSNPVFDVYNPTSFEKTSGIKDLEKKNKKLKSGIVKLTKKSINSKFVKDLILEIVTTDGITCFYDVQKDLLFFSEKEVNDYIEKTNIDIMSEYLVAFVLGNVSGSSYQKQLYVITSAKTNKVDELMNNAGSSYFDYERFNKDKRYNCKKCNAQLLSDEKFLESKMIYFDTSMVMISCVESMKEKADAKITAIDKNGKVLFVVPNIEFPNLESMKEDEYTLRSSPYLKCTRHGGQMVFHFKEYGSLCYDLETGKQLWKYEP